MYLSLQQSPPLLSPDSSQAPFPLKADHLLLHDHLVATTETATLQDPPSPLAPKWATEALLWCVALGV